jgi:hypothetical protein
MAGVSSLREWLEAAGRKGFSLGTTSADPGFFPPLQLFSIVLRPRVAGGYDAARSR